MIHQEAFTFLAFPLTKQARDLPPSFVPVAASQMPCGPGEGRCVPASRHPEPLSSPLSKRQAPSDHQEGVQAHRPVKSKCYLWTLRK